MTTGDLQQKAADKKDVRKKIAIIGGGISGLSCAHLLADTHHVEVFEAAPTLGGHTATKTVATAGGHYDVDTGFIVFNDRTYPHFLKLLAKLKVDYQKTSMGFSVTNQVTGYEYAGTSLNGLFAQRRNLASPQHWRLLGDILRFNKLCIRLHDEGAIPDTTLGDFLAAQGFSEHFSTHYILPMVSAIWSSGLATAARMPLLFFIRFFHNHGLLTVTQQPQWYTITGGSKSYLAPLTENFKDNIHLACPVIFIRRTPQGVIVYSQGLGEQLFDEVVLACHSDQALKLIVDPTPEEYEILSAIPYRANKVQLHADTGLLPRSVRAWASWNYRIPAAQADDTEEAAVLTYNMNILQNLAAPVTFCVSVNAGDQVNPAKLYGTYDYAHPVFTRESVAAQTFWASISGQNRTHFCGAYWRNGFHEDGLVSGIRVAQALGADCSALLGDGASDSSVASGIGG